MSVRKFDVPHVTYMVAQKSLAVPKMKCREINNNAARIWTASAEIKQRSAFYQGSNK
jgi:hypothetical protein